MLALQEDFLYEDMEALCSALRTLATDSNKYRAKADRRRQRSTFRAVLHFVEVRVRTCVLGRVLPGHRRQALVCGSLYAAGR